MTDVRAAPVERELAGMTCTEKIGQMVMVGFAGATAGADVARLIAGYRIGGVVLFARNCSSPAQVRVLCSSLQEMSRRPLFIAVDQEGGVVARLQYPVTVYPSNMALGATRSPALAREAAQRSGRVLRSLGVNVNFAPVVDVNSNPRNPVIGVRSFGEDAGLVSTMAAAAVEGYRSAGVLATAKHFPGHGDTATDSHLGLPVATAGWERLAAIELPPFVAAIKAGAAFVMTSHVMFPQIGARHPATLAPEALTGLLRRRLGFDGVICTDCLEMEAIAGHYGVGEAAVLAIEAGADLVLISHRLDRQLEAINALRSAAASGRLSAQRIDQSLRRLLAAKHAIAVECAAASVSFPDAGDEQAALRMARAATTVLRNDGVLPLRRGSGQRLALVEFVLGRATLAENEAPPPSILAAALRGRAPDVEVLSVSAWPDADAERAVMACAAQADVVVVATQNASLIAEQSRLVTSALSVAKRGVVAAIRNPYDLALFSGAAAQVAIYGNPPCSLQALVEVLFGEASPGGLLPVTMPDVYAYGAGICRLS